MQNIPSELRERAQFVVWHYAKIKDSEKLTKPPLDPKTGWSASVTEPNHWSTFDQALAAFNRAEGRLNGVGYVITRDDPYTFIDLDTHDPKLTDEDRKRHQKIAETFKGYAEISPSGKGLHLIIKGKVPSGRRRAGIEIYSAERYMTLTGNVWRDGPILPQQELLTTLWEELAPEQKANGVFVSKPEFEPDDIICNRAANASNGTKFVNLYQGYWKPEYASQSEADFALVDIIAYYTQNVEQIKRIFRASVLGARDKAKRDNYMNPMIARAMDNQPPPINLDALKAKFENLQLNGNTHNAVNGHDSAPLMVLPTVPTIDDQLYSLPPGLVGEIANYIYSAAPRQVREIALVGALGLMAGICGRSYNVSGTGLNQYFLLIAKTGSGKEAIASGISQLMREVKKTFPAAADFIGPGEIASAQALSKYLLKKSPSFITIGGEFGHTLSQMAIQGNNAHLQGIRRLMLNLYHKSGKGSTLDPMIYADIEKNTTDLRSPAFSFIGESASEPFYEAVDERLIMDGLLPRFTLIEYRGKRVDLNENCNGMPPADLVQRVGQLCAQSLQLNKADQVIDVLFEPAAKALFTSFEVHCTQFINAGEAHEVGRHIWNRAHLQAMKLAAVVAVGANPFKPLINLATARWGVNLAQHNAALLLNRFERGEFGSVTSDDKHVSVLRKVIRDYYSSSFQQVKSYIGESLQAMFQARILPFVYLQRRCVALSAFRTDRRGAKIALDCAIKTLIDSGVISEVNKMDIVSKFQFSGKCYYLSSNDAKSLEN
jgi:hypothetical protein